MSEDSTSNDLWDELEQDMDVDPIEFEFRPAEAFMLSQILSYCEVHLSGGGMDNYHISTMMLNRRVQKKLLEEEFFDTMQEEANLLQEMGQDLGSVTPNQEGFQ